MPSSWPANRLLPALQVIAEGSWLAVVYAAGQALVGEPIRLGPGELALAAWAGLAWGRRRRWRSADAEVIGFPLLALATGVFGWIMAPEVRADLVAGDVIGALGRHAPGWIGALAFWRGEVHRTREEDDWIQDRLLRRVLPALAIPWTVGSLAATGAMRDEFTAAAFVGTIVFVASAFMAMGLARLEATRQTTGSDWRANRAWLLVVLATALVVTGLGIPAAILLGVPASSLLTALLGPVQLLMLAFVLIMSPVLLLAAFVAELLTPILPQGFGMGDIQIPNVAFEQRDATSGIPTVVVFLIVGLLIVLELFVLGVIIWLRHQERERMQALAEPGFEERAIVIPPREAAPLRRDRSETTQVRLDSADPAQAYLVALRSLEPHETWRRAPTETPAAHAARVRRQGLMSSSLPRLAAAYQLVRYADVPLSATERRRTRGRLDRLRRALAAAGSRLPIGSDRPLDNGIGKD